MNFDNLYILLIKCHLTEERLHFKTKTATKIILQHKFVFLISSRSEGWDEAVEKEDDDAEGGHHLGAKKQNASHRIIKADRR